MNPAVVLTLSLKRVTIVSLLHKSENTNTHTHLPQEFKLHSPDSDSIIKFLRDTTQHMQHNGGHQVVVPSKTSLHQIQDPAHAADCKPE